jgi:hypothetical protein
LRNCATGVDLVIMAAVQQMDKTAFELHKKNDKPAQQSITGSRAPGGVGTRETLSTGRFQRAWLNRLTRPHERLLVISD